MKNNQVNETLRNMSVVEIHRISSAFLLKRKDTTENVMCNAFYKGEGKLYKAALQFRSFTPFTKDDEATLLSLIMASGLYNDAEFDYLNSGHDIFVSMIVGPKPVKKAKATKKSAGYMATDKILEESLWAMKEMFSCLCGFESEMGEGFAHAMVKDERKMMKTAEKMIPYMQSLLEAVKKNRAQSGK